MKQERIHQRPLGRRTERRARQPRREKQTILDDRTRWFYSERAAERKAIEQSENPPTPTGYFDQFGDWHEGWFTYPAWAFEVDRRREAARIGTLKPQEIDIFADD